jgi:assimilatory nitrate reductase catalytic subunit
MGLHLNTPLWPAGHLPLKGGDQPAAPLSPLAYVAEWSRPMTLLISPFEGEMAGRPEGGAYAPA